MSVVMPVRDMEATVGAQLNALAGQDFRGTWELVVVDNRSEDSSFAVVEKWRDRLPLRVVRAEVVAECGYAKNVGAGAARGELLVFCDADDEVRSDWLGAMVSALQGNSLVAGVFEYAKLNPRGIALYHDRVDYRAPRWGFLPSGTGANLGIRRSLFEQLGRFRAGRWSDTALCWRAQLAGNELVFEPSAVVHRRLKARSAWRMFTLSLANGGAAVQHYREFRTHGMRRSPLRDITYDFLIVPAYLVTGRRFEAAWTAGARLGRWLGSLRLHVLCL